MLKQQIEQDLKTALLAGDKTLATTLRSLKSVILYAEVAQGTREEGLSDEGIEALFVKEVKKRQESADLYKKGGNSERAQSELAEKSVIESYLPKQLKDDELRTLVEQSIEQLGVSSMQGMGLVIAEVKKRAGNSADGGRIAQFVKERLS